MAEIDPVEAIIANLNPRDAAKATKAIEKLNEIKGKSATIALANLLLDAPAGPIASRAAAALERRRHKSALEILHKAYDTRADLLEDVLTALSPIADEQTLERVIRDAKKLMRSPARLITLELLENAMEKRPLGTVLLDLRYGDDNRAGHSDIDSVLTALLKSADDATLQALGAHAARISETAAAFVKPYLPPESELEREAPRIARAMLEELRKRELIEIMPGSEDALVIQLARTMVEAPSPKALLRDVERILEGSPATEELFATRDDIKQILEKLARSR